MKIDNILIFKYIMMLYATTMQKFKLKFKFCIEKKYNLYYVVNSTRLYSSEGKFI